MPRYSDDKLYAAIREVAERVGQAPTANQYREHSPDGAPSARQIINRHKAGGSREITGRGMGPERPWVRAE